MKANEAPEKLYIDLFKGEFNVSYSPTNNSVEYTRTDAFIENRGDMATVNVKHLAKHFFELGMLSTITEEDCKLIWNISDELPCMPEEDFFKELLRRYKAQKGE